MANTVFSYETGKSGFVADLSFGPRANNTNTYANQISPTLSGAGNINQLYAYYNVNDKLTLTAGHFNTYLGYEVISPAANFNYTVSYLFNAGPFSHTGIKADYAVDEDWSVMLAITNPHGAQGGLNTQGNYQYGAQVGFKGQFLNVIYGADADTAGAGAEAFYIDYTGGFDLAEAFFLGINAAYKNDAVSKSGYQGIALYPQYSLSEETTLGLRPEFFQTTFDGDATEDIFALTATVDQKLDDNFSVKLEARYDNNMPANGTDTDNAAILAAAIYSF